jgi:hypothetical protein
VSGGGAAGPALDIDPLVDVALSVHDPAADLEPVWSGALVTPPAQGRRWDPQQRGDFGDGEQLVVHDVPSFVVVCGCRFRSVQVSLTSGKTTF